MWRARYCARAVAVVTLVGLPAARAETRAARYHLSYENLAAYPDYVFFIYPTTNAGVAYRVEQGKSVTTDLMMRKGFHESPGTSLYALKKVDFDKSPVTKSSYAHGDQGEMVQSFHPPGGAVASNLLVTPPPEEQDPFGMPLKATPNLTRVFRVAKITEQQLELVVVKNEVLLADGTKKEVPFDQVPAPAPPPPPAPPSPPKKRGCAVADGSEAPSVWVFAALFAFARSRRRAS